MTITSARLSNLKRKLTFQSVEPLIQFHPLSQEWPDVMRPFEQVTLFLDPISNSCQSDFSKDTVCDARSLKTSQAASLRTASLSVVFAGADRGPKTNTKQLELGQAEPWGGAER